MAFSQPDRMQALCAKLFDECLIHAHSRMPYGSQYSNIAEGPKYHRFDGLEAL